MVPASQDIHERDLRSRDPEIIPLHGFLPDIIAVDRFVNHIFSGIISHGDTDIQIPFLRYGKGITISYTGTVTQ
jgi:hypothetical protein